MRISESSNITPRDIKDQNVIIRGPKSGREVEVVFIPQKVGDRLKEHIRDRGIKANERIFPITYPLLQGLF